MTGPTASLPDPDQALLAQIEASVRGAPLPPDAPPLAVLAAQLAHMQPEADSAFRQRLLAHLQAEYASVEPLPQTAPPPGAQRPWAAPVQGLRAWLRAWRGRAASPTVGTPPAAATPPRPHPGYGGRVVWTGLAVALLLVVMGSVAALVQNSGVLKPPTTAGQAMPFSITPEGAGIRLGANNGSFGWVSWVGPDHLLLEWSNPISQTNADTYLLTLPSGPAYPLGLTGEATGRAAQPTGQYTVILTGDAPGTFKVQLLDTRTHTLETVFALDPTVTQWAAPGDRQWTFGQAPVIGVVTWVGTSGFVLTLVPQGERNVQEWGKVLWVDVATRRVRTLMEQGQVAAVLPDGGVLVRPGWVDGPLEFMAAPGTGSPQPIAPGGPWTSDWVVSPDGQRVAWFEATAPLGDWSQRLPYIGGSGDPVPSINALVIWDRSTRQVTRFLTNRFPVIGIGWGWDHLYWRKDSKTLLFTGPTRPKSFDHYALIGLDPSGQIAVLAQPEWGGPIEGVVEGGDGTLYLSVLAGIGSNGVEVARRTPDGRMEELATGLLTVTTTEGRLLITDQEQHRVTAYDLATGAIVAPPVAVGDVSPDGRWILQSDENRSRLLIMPIK